MNINTIKRSMAKHAADGNELLQQYYRNYLDSRAKQMPTPPPAAGSEEPEKQQPKKPWISKGGVITGGVGLLVLGLLGSALYARSRGDYGDSGGSDSLGIPTDTPLAPPTGTPLDTSTDTTLF